MSREFRGVEGLDGGEAVGEVAGVGDVEWVLEGVGAFGEFGEEEVDGGVGSGLVVVETVFVGVVVGDDGCGFESGGSCVF